MLYDRAVPSVLEYQPGTVLSGLALDQRHVVRLRGWEILELLIHPGPTPRMPEQLPPIPTDDDEDWTIERLEIADR